MRLGVTIWRRAAIVVVLAIAARYTVDFSEIWRVFADSQRGYLAAAVTLAIVDRLMMAFKWWHLIRGAHGRIRFAAVASAYFQATFVGHVLPSAVTSEVLRCYLVCRRGIERATALFSMAAERLIGAAATLTLAVAAAPVIGVHASHAVSTRAAVSIAAAVTAAGVGVAWPLRRRMAARAKTLTARLVASQPWPRRGAVRLVAANFLLAVAEQLLQVSIVVFVAAALGVARWSIAFFAALVVITSVRRIVAYVESWGLAEGVSVGLYTTLGMNASGAAALAIATYAVLVTAVVPGGILMLRRPSADRWPAARAPHQLI
jgi:uncharacterized protein (TIRG00374 family)